MKNPKYKVSPRGKRKLDYTLKKSRSNVKLPLIGKTIYLDVKENKQLKQLQCDLKRLGATLEEFVSRDINYLITAQPRPRNKGQSCHGDESPAASPFNCEPSPSPLNVEDKKVTSVTRGKALAEKARIARKPNTLLDNAEQWGVKIVSLEGAFKWIDKELKKLPKVSTDLSKNRSKCVSSYKTLKSPFVKIEAESYCYRPFHIELEVWPRLNVDTPRGSCPFDGTLIKGGEESREERGDLLAAQVDIPSEDLQKNNDDTGNSAANSGKPPTDKSCKKSETEVAPGNRILTAGELKRRKELKRKQERKRGYCECCHVKYEDLDKHVKEEQHTLYVRNKSNYEKLDTLIYTGPNSQHFLAEYMKKSALQTIERENKSAKSSTNTVSPRKSPRKTIVEHCVHPSHKSPRKPSVHAKPSNLKSPRKNQRKDTGNSLLKTTERVDRTQEKVIQSPRKSKDTGNSLLKTTENDDRTQEKVIQSPRKSKDTGNSLLKTTENDRTREKGIKSPRKGQEDGSKIQENKQPKNSSERKDGTDAMKTKVDVLKNLDNNTSVTVATVTVDNQDFLSSPRKMRDRTSLNKSAVSPLKNEEILKTTPRSLVKCLPISDQECSNKDIKCVISDKTVPDDSNKENIEPGKYIEEVKTATNSCSNHKNVSKLNQGKHNKKKCTKPVVGADCESKGNNINVGDNVSEELTETEKNVHNSDIEKCFYKIVKLGKERTCREASSDDFEVCFARFSQYEELPESTFKSPVNKINKSFDSMIESSEWQKGVKSPSKRKGTSTIDRVILFEQNEACEDVNEKNEHQNSEMSDASVNKTSYNNKVATDNENSRGKVNGKHGISEKNNVSKKLESVKKNVHTDKESLRLNGNLLDQRNCNEQNVPEATNEEVKNDAFVVEDLSDLDGLSVTYTKTLAERIKERALGRRSSVKSYNLNELFSPRSEQSNDSFKGYKIDRVNRKSSASEKKLVKKRSGSCVASAKVLNKYRNQRHGNSISHGETMKGYQGDDECEKTPGSYKSKINSESKQKKQKTKFWHYVEEKPYVESKEQLKDLPKELRLLKDGLGMDLSVVRRRALVRHSQIDEYDTSVTSGSEIVVKEKLDVKKKAKKFWHYEPVVESNDSDQNEAFKDLPKELRLLKESLNGFQSDSLVGKRRSRSCANRSSIVASDSENDWENVEKENTESNVANIPRCSIESRLKELGESTCIQNKKKKSHQKQYFHYVPILDTDIVKDNESYKNLPRELRELKQSLGSINGDVESRRRSRTRVRTNKDQDMSTGCEKIVIHNNVNRTIEDDNDVISNQRDVINKTGLLANHQKSSWNRTKRNSREIFPNFSIERVIACTDEDSDKKKMVRMRRRRQTPSEAKCGYEIRKKDPNISYKEVDTDHSDDFSDEMCANNSQGKNYVPAEQLHENKCEQLEECKSRSDKVLADLTCCNEILKKGTNINCIENDTKHSVDLIDETDSYVYKKGKLTNTTGKDQRFWMYVAEVDGDSDDDSEFENMPKELRDLKLWKMKSGSTSGSRSRSRGKRLDYDESDDGLLEGNIDQVVGEEQTCLLVAKKLPVADSKMGKKIGNCEEEKTETESKHSRTKSRKRKVFWEYEAVIDNDNEDNKSLHKFLPNELRNLVDSWSNVSGDNLPRTRHVRSRDCGKIGKNKTEQMDSDLGDGEEDELIVCKNNNSVSNEVSRRGERSKSPVFNRHQRSTNDIHQKRGSPVFKKSPKSNFHNSKPDSSDQVHKYKSSDQNDFCPDSDNELSDTIDEIHDCAVKYEEIEQAGSGYSRTPREKRRKKWKRKMKEIESVHADSQSNQKRRKIDDKLGKSENEFELKLKSPRRRILTHDNYQSKESNDGCDSFVKSSDLSEIKQSSFIWKPVAIKNLDTVQSQSWSMSNEKLNSDMESDSELEKRIKRNSVKGLCIKSDKRAAKSRGNSKQHRVEVGEDDYDSIEEDYEQYVPVYISSPSRNSNSSWIETVDEYLDNSLKYKPDSSFKEPNSSLYFSFNRSPLKSPAKRIGSSPYKANPLNSASKLKSPSKICLRSPDKVHKSSPLQSPNVEKVDDDIEFNFGSPQKNCTEYSHLKTVQGVVRDLSSPVVFNINSPTNNRKSSTPNNRKSISKKLCDRLDS